MLVQGMNYLLDIKQDLLLTPNGWSNQQSALDFPLFSFFSIIFYCVSFLYSGTFLISLLSFYPMLRVRAFTPMLCQSIAADCLLFSLNDSLLLCKERI